MAFDHVTVQTTVETQEDAARLASALLEQRLAACVQVTAVRSFYRWDGQVQNEPEQLLTAKTTAAQVDGIKAFLAAEHPYEEAELIVQPITDGSAGYLAWLTDETTGSAPPR